MINIKYSVFLIVMLFVTGVVKAQQENELMDVTSYDQAIQAIEDEKFVFKANLYDDGLKSYSVYPTSNYIMLDRKKFIISYDSPKIRRRDEGTVTNFSSKMGPEGDVVIKLTAKLKDEIVKLNFTIRKGSNHCVVLGSPVRYYHKFIFIGELVPYETSDLVRPYTGIKEN